MTITEFILLGLYMLLAPMLAYSRGRLAGLNFQQKINEAEAIEIKSYYGNWPTRPVGGATYHRAGDKFIITEGVGPDEFYDSSKSNNLSKEEAKVALSGLIRKEDGSCEEGFITEEQLNKALKESD